MFTAEQGARWTGCLEEFVGAIFKAHAFLANATDGIVVVLLGNEEYFREVVVGRSTVFYDGAPVDADGLLESLQTNFEFWASADTGQGKVDLASLYVTFPTFSVNYDDALGKLRVTFHMDGIFQDLQSQVPQATAFLHSVRDISAAMDNLSSLYWSLENEGATPYP